MAGFFLDLILSFRSSVPGRRSIGCIGSIVAVLCGVVGLPICLTGGINSFWLSFSSVFVFVVVVVSVYFVVWGRVNSAIVFVPRVFSSIFRLFVLPFQQTALILARSWFFAMVARWFGSVSIYGRSMMAHSIYL